MIPTVHQTFLKKAQEVFEADERFVALLGAGSLITGTMDEFSDVDLVAVYNTEAQASVRADRLLILEKLGKLLSAFTGEHVGEPRVLICLYEDPLLHVDVKFVTLKDLENRVENPVILFERGGLVTDIYQKTEPDHPMPNLQWIEDRFWTWIHYSALRLGRGELFEAIDMLSFLRGNVFGPLALVQNGHLPRGVRRLETQAPNYAKLLEKTVPSYSIASCKAAVSASIELYRKLRDESSQHCIRRTKTERAAVDYFESI